MSELKTNLQSILQEKTEKIISQNIKKNVEVLGVTGSYDKEDIKELQDELDAAEAELAAVRRDLDNSTAEVNGSGENVTLNGTAEARFKKAPLPMGNSEQESTTGRNLLPTPEVKSQTINGVTISRFEDGTITIKGTPTAQMDVKFNFEESTFSTGSYIHFRNNFSTYNFAVSFRKDGVNKIAPGLAPLNNIYQIPEDITVNQMVVLCNNDAVGTAYDITLKPSIELTNEVTEYEPYTNGASPNPDYPQEITNVTGDVEVVVSNKNLGTFMSGFISLQGDYRTSSDMCFYFRVTKGQSYRYQSTGNRSIGAIFDSVPTENQTECIDGTLFNPLPKQSAFVAPASGIMVIYTNLNFSQEVMDSFQVEKGTEATSVVPHKSQTFTFPLGNEKLMLGDYLADDGIHHVRKQVVLDGSDDERWYKNWEEDENHRVFMADKFLPDSKRFPSPTTNILCKSNYFKAVCYDAGDESIWRLRRNDNYPNLIAINDSEKSAYVGTVAIKYDASSDINEFKTWLSTHNVIVQYELAEEVIVPYTSAQQEVYNAIKQALSYEEQTNVSGSSNGANPKFDVIALRNMNDTLNTLENEIELLP